MLVYITFASGACVCVCVLKIIFDDVMTLVCVNDIHSQLGGLCSDNVVWFTTGQPAKVKVHPTGMACYEYGKLSVVSFVCCDSKF